MRAVRHPTASHWLWQAHNPSAGRRFLTGSSWWRCQYLATRPSHAHRRWHGVIPAARDSRV